MLRTIPTYRETTVGTLGLELAAIGVTTGGTLGLELAAIGVTTGGTLGPELTAIHRGDDWRDTGA